MDLMLFGARVVLAIVFAVAGLAKLADRPGTRALAMSFGAPASLAGLIALLLPVAELACAVMLIPAATATVGATATLALLAVFIVAISWSLVQGRRPDCRCFGQLQSSPIGWATVVRNLMLSGLAVFVIVQGRAWGQPEFFDAFASFDALSWGTAAFIAIVAVIAFGALAMTVQLLRQNGRLALRIEALEARLGVQPSSEPGLPVGVIAPRFWSDNAPDGQVLLFFKQDGCSACEAMLPEVEAWKREHQHLLRIVTLGDKELADAYQVSLFPTAVLVTDGLVASALAEGGDAIRSLVTTATLPPPYAKGDLVASHPLKDLDGRSIDLGQLAGRRTVLLFWNPGCGFCNKSLDDVKQWEREEMPGQAALVVISAGDEASNRAQGFQSRVVLDADFSVSSRFGSRGTPSALIIDELGRIGSDVVAGGLDVLALARSATVVGSAAR